MKITLNLSQSSSSNNVTAGGVNRYLHDKLAKKLITAAHLQRVMDWIQDHPREFRQQATLTRTDGIMASRLFKRLVGKDIPHVRKSKDA